MPWPAIASTNGNPSPALSPWSRWFSSPLSSLRRQQPLRFLFLDYANLAIHEAGHPLFGILGGGGESGFGTRSWSWAAHSSNS
jgi:hypothetical protein